MAYAELIAAAYVSYLAALITADDPISRLTLKAPLLPISAFLFADALIRLGFLPA